MDVVVSWSGGKDSALALWRARARGLRPIALLTMLDASGETGEYHTVVTAGPIFTAPVPMSFGAPQRRGDHWAVEVRLATAREARVAGPGAATEAPRPSVRRGPRTARD